MKTCRLCHVSKPEGDFFKNRRARDGLFSHCKACDKPLRGKRNGESINRHRARRYGLTAAQYDAMLAAQGGRCANPGCRRETPGTSDAFSIDHDHACCPGKARSCGNCIRGLLCIYCNCLLGFAQDDPAVLLGAVEYLRAHSPKKPA